MKKEDLKDLTKVGLHGYDRESSERYIEYGCKTFSVNIFQWVLKYSKKEIKPSKCVVRVSGKPEDKEKVFAMCDLICKQLDLGEWDGRKTARVFM